MTSDLFVRLNTLLNSIEMWSNNAETHSAEVAPRKTSKMYSYNLFFGELLMYVATDFFEPNMLCAT